MTHSPVSRRTVLGGAAAVGGAALLAACGSDDAPTDAADGAADDAAAADDAGADESEGASGEDLIAAAEVPVGGGVIVGAAQVVVTQPSEDTFAGFSSTCTHQGCQVSSVSDGLIICACHNSQFSIEDGSVVAGPATAPLPPVPVALDGDQVVTA